MSAEPLLFVPTVEETGGAMAVALGLIAALLLSAFVLGVVICGAVLSACWWT